MEIIRTAMNSFVNALITEELQVIMECELADYLLLLRCASRSD